MVIHDVGAKHPEHSIVAIENGHVTGRKVGDGASHVVLEQVRQADAQPSDHLSYLTKTPDGKILKSSTMYIRGRSGKVAADKMRAIGFLSQNGAFLVTKSGDKIAKYFGISKYTLYSYIDKQQEEK